MCSENAFSSISYDADLVSVRTTEDSQPEFAKFEEKSQ